MFFPWAKKKATKQSIIIDDIKSNFSHYLATQFVFI